MEAAFSRGKDLESVTQMIFATNFAAIHTSSNVSALSRSVVLSNHIIAKFSSL